jgi:hypothetical protein
MTSSRTRLSPLLRSLAAVMLLMWVAAVTACSTKCLCADSDSEHMGQMPTASSQSHDSHGSDKDCNHDDTFCTSLHSLTPVSTAAVLDKPDFRLAFTVDFLSTAQLVTVAQAETSISRQPPDPEWVFTPEVCLGASSRSHAPPVLA